MKLAEVSRKQAFFTHLSISFMVFLVISALIVLYWYPDFYFFLDGGNRGMATIFFVDVVLGPGLTWLVFKPGKKSLKFDLAVIFSLQLAALSWGIDKVYADRPVTTVFYLGKFNCLSESVIKRIDRETIFSGPSGVQRLSFLQRPDTVEAYSDFMREALQNGTSEIYYYSDRLTALDHTNVRRLRKYALNLDELRSESAIGADRVTQYIAEHPGYRKDYGLYPLECRFGTKVAIFDMNELRITGLLDVNTRLRATFDDRQQMESPTKHAHYAADLN